MSLKILVSFLTYLFPLFLLAQNGSVRGTIFDKLTGEFLPGVTIVIEGTSVGTITDLDGHFNLNAVAGSYNLQISYISYETIKLQGVEIKDGDVTVLDDIGLSEAQIQLNEVTVTARQIRNTESAMISVKRKSPHLIDGISSAGLKKIGDSDAASSMKRVPGVSVSGGKYVYVRGLGDRYTKTTLNAVDIPGLDPDRNSLQMDIFPTNVIDNIIVHKSFSAHLPADFTGGVINIETKDFPTEQTSTISFGLGYNPGSHFNSNYLSYKGGKLDMLGFDDGTRNIPAKSDIPEFAEFVGNPEGESAQRHSMLLSSFDPTMAAMKERSFMDINFGLSYGNQKNLEKYTIGYNLAVSYKNNTDYYENAINGKYGLVNGGNSGYDMEQRSLKQGSYGVNNVYLSALAGFAIKTNTSKVRLNILRLQSGEKQAGIFDVHASSQGSDYTAFEHDLDYSERSLSNVLMDGKHNFKGGKWKVVWKVSPSLSQLDNPDVRYTRYKISDDGFNNYSIGTEVGFPARIWRELQEVNASNMAHITREFTAKGQKAKLHFGGAYTYKFRDYSIYKFELNVRDNGNLSYTGDPNELLSGNLFWPYNGSISEGISLDNNFHPSNRYKASVNYSAGFVSTELSLLNNLMLTAGLRVESYVQHYSGQNQTGDKILENDKVLEDLNVFPALNLIYKLTEKQNIRLSYTTTIARPSFKELSYAEIYDPISGAVFLGGLHHELSRTGDTLWNGNLVSSNIQNFDLRWELYNKRGQMISLSGFYKLFKNPIELIQSVAQQGAYQPRNVGNGQVMGVELEIRQKLDFIWVNLANFSLNSNITITESHIQMSNTEYYSRLEQARIGETIGNYRDMAGQAPYIVNAGLSFDGADNGFFENFEAGVYYNVQGLTLEMVGINDRPDIYTNPFHSLNLNSNLTLGKNDKVSVGFKVKNILGAHKESVYKSYKAQNEIYKFRNPGTSFSMSVSYNFF